MLNIMLTILKVLGIILASLFGLLLAIVLIILFVPIGYSAIVDKQKDLLAKGKVWWLFRAIQVSFFMDKSLSTKGENDNVVIKVQILGISILDTSRERKEKVVKAKKERQLFKKREKTESVELSQAELTTQEVPVEEKKENLDRDELEPLKQENENKNDDIATKEKKKKVKRNKKKKKSGSIVQSLKITFENLKRKIGTITEKTQLIKAFFQDEENKKAITMIFSSIKKILKHLLPNKIEGRLKFGTENPATTGQVLGILAIFYCYYGKSVSIEPDFSGEFVIDGNLSIKGKIRIVVLCVIAIKLLLNRNFKKLLRNVKKLKEEL